MKLESIVKALRPVLVKGSLSRTVKGLSYDSRTVSPGYIFVALPGLLEDGNGYVDEAIERGAVAVVTEVSRHLPRGATLIEVGHAREALADLACAFHRDPSSRLETFGVTGTNGKTTVTWLLKGMLKDGGMCPGMMGTVAHHIGEREIPAARTTPEAPEVQAMMDQMGEAGCRSVVMEVSSHALDQSRVRGVDFQVAVFTNLSQDHLDYHGDMEGYFLAKRGLFVGLRGGGGRAVINVDDVYGRRLLEDGEVVAEKVSYGVHGDADVRASNVVLSLSGTRFDVETPWGSACVETRLLGDFNVSNVLAAIAAGGVSGLSLASMVRSLAVVCAPPGRLEPLGAVRGHVFVDYAHTDQALANVLATMGSLGVGRVGVVFGCGGCRDKGKRPLMAAAVEAGADFAVVTNDNPRQEEPSDIVADVLKGFSSGMDVDVVLDRREAIAHGIRRLGADDVLVIAGKGHENYMEFKKTVVPFDDRGVALEILSASARGVF